MTMGVELMTARKCHAKNTKPIGTNIKGAENLLCVGGLLAILELGLFLHQTKGMDDVNLQPISKEHRAQDQIIPSKMG